MHSFYHAAAVAAAPQSTFDDPTLTQLIAARVEDWTSTDLLGLTHLVIIEAGDTEEDIVYELGFSPLENLLSGWWFGQSEFEPSWDWLERHDGWFELIFTVGNDGFAFVLFIADVDGTEPKLRALCRTYAESEACAGS